MAPARGLGLREPFREALKTRLAAEGLFAPERKRALPRFPFRVALVTSRSADGARDFITQAAARAPHVEIVVETTPVQGEKAAPEIAREGVALLRTLYAVEKQAKEVSVAERFELRQAKSLPVLAELREKLLAWKEQLLPKHPMAEAVNYTLGQWTELNVFCKDGAVPIDNNLSEREMKRVVLNRKNSLFVGNPRGGRTAAILASLTSTCRRHEIDPQLYLTQVLVNFPSWPARDLDSWLPDQWKLR